MPLPKSLKLWLVEDNVLRSQPLHPLQHTLQLFTDASSKGWGAHLGDCTARGLWSNSEGKLHINFPELKAVLLALQRCKHVCWGQTILVATDTSGVLHHQD